MRVVQSEKGREKKKQVKEVIVKVIEGKTKQLN